MMNRDNLRESSNNACAPRLSRRNFVKGAAAAAATVGAVGLLGACAPGAGTDIKHPEGTVDPEAPVEIKYSYCDMCNHAPKCGIKAFVQDGKIVRAESRTDWQSDPLCAKGLSALQELYDPNRLLKPKKRTNPKGETSQWEDISWDEAYAEIAEKLNDIKARYGATAVMFYCGDPKEPRGPMTRLATLFGSASYGAESSVCATASWVTANLVFGMMSMGVDPNAEATKAALIWSLNPAWSQPYRFGQFMKAKANGCKFVVVDPRITPLVTGAADIHLRPRPGSDGALAAGFINQLIEQDLIDHDFIANWTVGFEELKAYVAEYTPEKVEQITWVPADKLIAAAKLIGENSPSTLVSSSKGACHHTNVGHFQRAVFMIPALLGQLDVKGGFTLGGGLPLDYTASTAKFNLEEKYVEDGLPALRLDKDDFPVFAKYLKMLQTVKLPEYVAEGKLRAAILLGTNAMMWPDTPKYQKAIQDMEFTVAIDYYERNWTHDYVDMLLPAAMCYERMAALAVFGRTIRLREPVVAPAGESREDWQIILEIGTALGFGAECFNGSVEAALEEVLASSGLEVTMADLRAKPEGVTIEGAPEERKYESGKLRKDGQPGFNTPSGKVEFVSQVLQGLGMEGLPIFEEPVHSPVSRPDEAADYPLILNTGSRLPYYTHSKLRDLPWLNQFMPEPVIRLNPVDAGARDLNEGDAVRVFNWQGEVKMKVEITNLVLPGVVDVFHGWHQADINLLTTRDFDPITGFPPFSGGLCEVAKA
jgi:anaerobic selenocysteine-containing dehydrogenase